MPNLRERKNSLHPFLFSFFLGFEAEAKKEELLKEEEEGEADAAIAQELAALGPCNYHLELNNGEERCSSLFSLEAYLLGLKIYQICEAMNHESCGRNACPC